KYTYNSYSNVTDYEYWDANSYGVTTCDGYRILVGGNPVNFSMTLDYEPSWQLYKKKTYSPELPNAYQQEENFYFYDLRNEAFATGFDTLQNFYALNFSSGYKMRNLLYETRTTTKSQAFNPIVKSIYYWYDARFDTQADFELDGTYSFSSPNECGTIEEEEDELPTPPHTSCVPELPGHPIPPGFNLVITGEEGYRWWCPSSIYGTATDYQYPHYEYEQPGENREQIHFRDLKKKVFLRYIAQQVDTNPNETTEYTSIDHGANNIMRFKLFTQTGIEGYRPVYPFTNLINLHIDERNIYGQVKLEHDAKNLQTLYEYDEEQLYLFVDAAETCNNHYIPSFTNVGLPSKVTVGYTLADELSTFYSYYEDHSVKRVYDPNEIEMEYIYDEYTRLKETERNGILISKNNYHYWDNDFNKTFEERAADNYVETFTINENNSLIAERSRAYIDPQGRKLDVLTQISPDYTDPLEYDTKTIHKGLTIYDNWNRNINQYKPFKTGDGINPEDFSPAVNPNPITDPSQKAQHENSQRSRPLRTSKYGQDIVSGYTVNSSYVLIKGNVLASSGELGLTPTEKAFLMPGGITNYTFLKTSAIDEDGKKVITYSDPIGRQIASKTYINPTTVATTLFIYDSQMKQAMVVNPEKQLSTYLYNLSGQLSIKTTVDAGETRYIYNSDGKIVLEEDDNARAGIDNSSNPYMRRFHYDDFGRLIKQERTEFTGSDPYLHPFYDQIFWNIGDFTATSPYDNLTSIATEKEFFYHNPLNLSQTFLDNRLVSYMGTYSQASNPATLFGKPSYTIAYNNAGLKTKLTAFKYNNDGTLGYEIHQFDPTELVSGTRAKVQAVKYLNYNLRGSYKDIQVDDELNNTNNLIQEYEYDGWNRLTTVHANNIQIAQYNYIDELGLIEKVKLYNIGENTCTLQTDEIQYSYDVRDRLTAINNHFLEQTLYYDNNTPNTGSGLTNVLSSNNYNGNINANKIKYNANLASNYSGMGSCMDEETYYGYTYDGMNRLTRADASVMNVLGSVSSTADPELKYGDEQYTYDKVGNIKTLKRGIYYLPGTGSPANEINNWIYYYTSGTNQLNEIVHNTGTFLQNVSNYTYDNNGNLRTDTKKEITASAYGRGNLPSQMVVDNENLNYLYNVNDNRIYKSNASTNKNEYYLQDQAGRTIGIYDYDSEEWTWYAYGK
ncbi:MAG: hypothetical protein JNL69_11570, partial [Bacteroidia bacterium]|nr:hypothetical protein [Bacteroidia bacterium]